ncbi:hypothetical protein TSUD_154910 [Trifolium subterraneum]|uniref:Uncharacterized protein n=1 Tax=Trifolium subterraneum TaxID=3900 RepID=A0A2Z6N719_TRISU|nr:hypothetical protein TSUD_154910 [Trifolium subterraneum]
MAMLSIAPDCSEIVVWTRIEVQPLRPPLHRAQGTAIGTLSYPLLFTCSAFSSNYPLSLLRTTPTLLPTGIIPASAVATKSFKLIIEAVGRKTTLKKEAAFASRAKKKAVVVEEEDDDADAEYVEE